MDKRTNIASGLYLGFFHLLLNPYIVLWMNVIVIKQRRNVPVLRKQVRKGKSAGVQPRTELTVTLGGYMWGKHLLVFLSIEFKPLFWPRWHFQLSCKWLHLEILVYLDSDFRFCSSSSDSVKMFRLSWKETLKSTSRSVFLAYFPC